MATIVSRNATSTQLLPPFPLLRLLFRQAALFSRAASGRWCADIPGTSLRYAIVGGSLPVEQTLDQLHRHARVERHSGQSLELIPVAGNLGRLLFVVVSRKSF